MKTLQATFKIVTPMFLGGADRNEPAELREPSIKGILRFWWRALNWGRFAANSDSSDENKALLRLRTEEDIIFGNSSGKTTGQGLFLMQLTQRDAR